MRCFFLGFGRGNGRLHRFCHRRLRHGLHLGGNFFFFCLLFLFCRLSYNRFCHRLLPLGFLFFGRFPCRFFQRIEVYFAHCFHFNLNDIINMGFDDLRLNLRLRFRLCHRLLLRFLGGLFFFLFFFLFLHLSELELFGYALFFFFLAFGLVHLLDHLLLALILLEALSKHIVHIGRDLGVRIGIYLDAFFGQIFHRPVHRDVELG